MESLLKHIQKHISLSEDDRQLLSSVVRERRLLRKQFLVQEGNTSKYENFVVEGCLRTFYVDAKGEIIPSVFP